MRSGIIDMREAKTKDICFICGTAHGAPEGGCCDVCGATPVESAIVHLLVKYSGGGEKSAVQSHDQLKFRRILAIDPPGGLDEAMTDCPLYRGVSAGEALSVRQAADGLPFDVILLFTQVDRAMAERLNGLLGDGGVVIARLDHDEPGVLPARLDHSAVEKARASVPALRHDRDFDLPL